MTRKISKTSDAARPLSCVLYIRVSTKLQVEKGESIDAQRFELTRYAENHDMRVLGEYVDAGFSGKNVQGRPQFRRMTSSRRSQASVRPTSSCSSCHASGATLPTLITPFRHSKTTAWNCAA